MDDLLNVDDIWPDPERRDAALQRLNERLAGNGYRNSAVGDRHYRRCPPRRSMDELTEREIEVIRCLSHGLGRLGAADAMGIGLESVKDRLRNAKRRVSAKDNAHLVAIAFREGLIE